MAPGSSLTFVLDENMGNLPDMLRSSRADAHDRVRTLTEIGIPAGTLDPSLLQKLGECGPHALISRDSRILHPLIQRGAWRDAKVTLFLLDGKWGSLRLGEIARRLLFLWPDIVKQAEGAPLGPAWRVSSRVPSTLSTTFRLVTGEHSGFRQ